MTRQRTGIFSGSFDPVHKGHIAFALEAIKVAGLDEVYFLPELKPRRKLHITHFAHRIELLKIAIKPHANLAVLELPDKQLSVTITLPRLRGLFPDNELFLLIGADNELAHIAKWPLAKQFLEQFGLVVAGKGKSKQEVENVIKSLPHPPTSLYFINSSFPEISSNAIRQSVAGGKKPKGLLPGAASYIKDNWLYSSAPSSGTPSSIL